jgi:hypothetical protein
VSALFLSAHSQGATQTRGHEVWGPRGAWTLPNLTVSVGFPGRPARAVNTLRASPAPYGKWHANGTDTV